MWTNKYAISLVKDNKLVDLVIVNEECKEEGGVKGNEFDSKRFDAYLALRQFYPNEAHERFCIHQLRKKPECKDANKKDPLPPGVYTIS